MSGELYTTTPTYQNIHNNTESTLINIIIAQRNYQHQPGLLQQIRILLNRLPYLIYFLTTTSIEQRNKITQYHENIERLLKLYVTATVRQSFLEDAEHNNNLDAQRKQDTT